MKLRWFDLYSSKKHDPNLTQWCKIQVQHESSPIDGFIPWWKSIREARLRMSRKYYYFAAGKDASAPNRSLREGVECLRL